MKTELDFSDYSDFTFQTPFDFAKNSSIGCGGVAAVVFYPSNVAEMVAVIEKLKKNGVEYRILGNLTNVLPPDGHADYAVVSTKKMDGIVMGERVFAYAGAMSGKLLHACKREKRSGLEFLSGIPCTLGGALYMNAGVKGAYISDVVENVLVLRDGERRILSWKDCSYAYKKSVFMENGDCILGATLRLERATEGKIEERERRYLERRLHLPKGKSMGCVFKNPPAAYAGELVEKSGLKGFRIGGAKISEQHANFIINEGTATSADIRALIAVAKNAVQAQYGIRLEEEIQYL